MASINYAAREISVKIVYYGPGLSGKTTNLQVIHRKVPTEYKSDMVSLATETDRTLFFDFLPLDLGKIKGFATKFQLYTVPGQVYYNATRKLVLRGVDGVVFVADSAPDKMQENIESFQNLEENLSEYGYKRENIPIIIQYNKRDLPNALPVEEMQLVFNKYNLAWSEAVANKGNGVFDSLKLIGKIVIDYLNKKYSRSSRPGATRDAARQTSQIQQNFSQQQQMGRRNPMPQRPAQQQMRPPRQQPMQQMPPSRQQPMQQQMRPRRPMQQMGPAQQPMPYNTRPAGQQQMRPPRQQPMQQMGPAQQQIRPPRQQPMQQMGSRQKSPGQNLPKNNMFRQQNPNYQQQFPKYTGNNSGNYQQPNKKFSPPERDFQTSYPQQQLQYPENTPDFTGNNQAQQFPAGNIPNYNQPVHEQNQGFDDSFDSYSQYQQSPDVSYTSDIQEDQVETFEPSDNYNKGVQQGHDPEMDYYEYGNISIEPMSNQQNSGNNIDSVPDDYSENQQQAVSFETNSGKTDLDMEIEKYQHEIEEKQRINRSQSSRKDTSSFQTNHYGGQNQTPQASYDQNNFVPQQQQYMQNTEDDDYDVYNLEVSFPSEQQQPSSAENQINTPVEDSDDMYFTSIDTDRQKKPVRRPVNPRTQQQKGFLSKLFNKDAP
jgi:signal recognition particle receptor subunit beta